VTAPPLSHLEALALLSLDTSERAGDPRPRLQPGDSLVVREALQARGLVDPPFDGWVHANLTPAGRAEVERVRALPPWVGSLLTDSACRALHHLRRQEIADPTHRLVPRSRAAHVASALWEAMAVADLVTLPGPRSALLTRRGRRLADDLASPPLAELLEAIAAAKSATACPDPSAYWGTCS
jgi:hypothetical protein